MRIVDDVSKSLMQITTPNFKEVQRKELFRSPSLATKVLEGNEDEKENRQDNAPLPQFGTKGIAFAEVNPQLNPFTSNTTNQDSEPQEIAHLDSFRIGAPCHS